MSAGLLIGDASWSSERCVKLLRRTELFGKFPFGALRALLAASRLVALKKSRPLFAENDAAQSAFLLADGVLRYSLNGAADRPIYLAPPAIIGETALIVGCLRPVTVIADTDAVLMEIPRATFLRVIAEFPGAAAHTRRLFFGHLRKLVGELDAVQLRLVEMALDAPSARDSLEDDVARAVAARR